MRQNIYHVHTNRLIPGCDWIVVATDDEQAIEIVKGDFAQKWHYDLSAKTILHCVDMPDQEGILLCIEGS